MTPEPNWPDWLQELDLAIGERSVDIGLEYERVGAEVTEDEVGRARLAETEWMRQTLLRFVPQILAACDQTHRRGKAAGYSVGLVDGWDACMRHVHAAFDHAISAATTEPEAVSAHRRAAQCQEDEHDPCRRVRPTVLAGRG